MVYLFIARYSSTFMNSTRTSDSSTAADESPQEANEASVATEIRNGESAEVNRKPSKGEGKSQVEVASRIVWTTPRAILQTTKEAVKESTEVLKGEKHTFLDSEIVEFQETLTSTMKNIRNESNGKFLVLVVTISSDFEAIKY